MLKRLILSLALTAGLIIPSFAAGTIPLSMTQQFDSLGKPLAGGQLYFIQAGTTSTPQNAYQDSALTLALPNPVTLDASGRIPQFFLADGSIKIRLTDKNGVTQVVADGILVIGPSSGGGGGTTVDPTTILATGDLKVSYGTGVLTGFVRANGRTIGSATSGASERANADTQALFLYLWSADANLAVSTGRGASAAADWAANKQLTLPDGRGRALAGLDDMGNSAAGIFGASTFALGNATTLGSRVGIGTPRTILTSNLPAYTPSGTVPVSSTLAVNVGVFPTVTNGAPTVTGYAGGGGTALLSGGVTASFNGNAQGGTSTAFDTVSPFLLITTYIKL